ncbi:hypothetical protein FKM82_009685 [Ascaphus truei]
MLDTPGETDSHRLVFLLASEDMDLEYAEEDALHDDDNDRGQPKIQQSVSYPCRDEDAPPSSTAAPTTLDPRINDP